MTTEPQSPAPADAPLPMGTLLARPIRFSPFCLALNLVVLAVLYFLDDHLMVPAINVLDHFDSLILDFARTMGEYHVLVVACLMMWLMRDPRRKMIPLMLVAATVAGLCMVVTKPVVGRVRPNHAEGQTFYIPLQVRTDGFDVDELRPTTADAKSRELLDIETMDVPGLSKLVYIDSPSFPSGHATQAMANASVLGYVFPPARPLFLTLAVSCGLSRTNENRHFLSDVWAGFLLGHYVPLGLIMLWRRRTLQREQLVASKESTTQNALASLPSLTTH